MPRIFAAFAAVVLAAAFAVTGAVPAHAVSDFYMVAVDGAGYNMIDLGHGTEAEVSYRTTNYHWINVSGSFGELESSDGNCLTLNTANAYVYNESCGGDYEWERWSFQSHLFENEYDGLYMATIDNDGGLVFMSSSTGVDSQWTVPGA